MDFLNMDHFKRSRLLHLCLAITFFASGIIVNIIQAIFYFTLRPWNKHLYRKINYFLCYTIYAQVVFVAEWWASTKLLLYIDKNDWEKYYGKEHGYCIMNHSYEIDWLMGWMACEKMKVLGNCKAYAKKSIQYLPVLGWGWKFAEFVFLERSFEKDKLVISKQITELADHPDPMWLLLFPEGTRFTEKKHIVSLEFAKKNNLPELKHHLLPRTKGFVGSLPSMRNKIPAIYDTVIAFNPNDSVEPTITNLLMAKPITAHMYIKRIPLEEVPESISGQEQFLIDMFLRKDRLKDSFFRTGDFFTESGVDRVKPWPSQRRICVLLNMIFWLVCILIPSFYYLMKLLFSGKFLYFSIGFSFILVFYVLLKKAISMTDIKSSSSSYGIDGHPSKKLN
ncbi:1-acyl-sn-glycerol-3-phosphate acyltransferase delta-like [Cylas formicarius]|uniref:1-acyl-sn-glycerol-3-phosphate acyltransferase delta-like n=1 Tax=Cylas formicarius TaxID=197179 RepID=UPI0029588E37|nr:1-acyl-sn-glycerol-3-phosphate acyltransferase delta-like [Cylas formicarius]